MTDKSIGNLHIGVEVDSSGAETTIDRFNNKSLKSMGEVAAQSAAKAATAIDGIASTTTQAAQKVDRATANIASQIERASAVLRAGGRDTGAFFAELGKQRGADLNYLDPLIKQYDQLKREQAAVGMSAAQMANNMRMVGPQITDIVTQLASGQAPMTVFIQQGGQLRDIFGGVVPAAKALGTSLLGLVNPYTVVGAGVLALGAAYKAGSAEVDAYNRALILSGNAAGTNSSALAQMARNLESSTRTQGASAAALAEMASSGKIAAENLQQFAGVAASMNRLLGTPLAETRKQFEDLAKSPTDAVLKLNESTNFLTASTLRQIKSLEDQGKAAQAAQVAGTAYADAMDGRMKNLEASLGLAERSWLAIKDAAKGAWDAMLNIGREKTLDDRLGEAQQRLAELQARAATPVIGVQSRGAKAKLSADTEAAQEQVNILMRQALLLDKVSQAEADRKDTTAATAAFLQLQDQMLTNVEKREREIAKARELGARGLFSQVEIERVIAGIRDKYKDKGSTGTTSAQQIAKDYEQGVLKLLKVQSDFRDKTDEATASQRVLNDLVEHGLNTWPDEYQKVVRALFAVGDAEEKTARARKLALDDFAARAKIEEEASNRIADDNEAIRKQLFDQIDATRKLGESKLGILQASERELELRILIARGEALNPQTSELDRLALLDRVKMLEQLRIAMRATFDKQQALDLDQAVRDSARNAANEWQRTADQIGTALATSIVDGGKSGWDSLRGYIKANVAVPLVKFAASPITNAIGSVFASPGVGAVNAAGGIVNGVGVAGTLGNAWNTFTGSGTTLAMSGLGQTLGLSTGFNASAAAALGSDAWMLSGTAAAGSLTSAGAIFATVAPWAAAAIALYSMFGGSGGGPKVGGSATASLAGLLPDATRLFTPAQQDSQLGTTVQQLVSSVDKLASTFGGSASGLRLALGFDTDPAGKAADRIASYVETAVGRVQFLQSGREVSSDALQAELATEGKRVMLAALQASNLQGGFAEFFSRLDPATASPDAIDNLVALAGAIKSFGESLKGMPGTLGKLAELSATAVDQLANASGGLDALRTNVGAFSQNFLSPAERLNALTEQLRRSLGDVGLGPDLALPTDQLRQWFRTTVDGIDVLTEAGRNQYAATIALATPLAQWIDATDALTKSAKDAADALRVQDLTTQRTALETEQSSLGSQMRALELVNGDLSKSLEELTNPTRTVAQRFADLGNEISGLEQQLASILGTGGLSLTDQLSAAVGARNSIGGARLSVQDQVNSAIVQGFVNRGDRQGAIDFLQTMENWLVSHIPTADNPADFASRASAVLMQRLGLQSELATATAQTELDLTRTAREARMTGLQTEIQNLETMRSVSDDIAKTLQDLRVGSLSALSPVDQLAAAATSFEQILAGARNGDLKALQALTGSGTQYLQEAQSFFASGGDYAGVFGSVTSALDSVGMQLRDVPTQIGIAQDQLTQLQQVRDAAVTTVDLSGDIVEGLQGIDTALGDALTVRNGSIDALVTAIQGQIAELRNAQDEAERQYGLDQERWTALDERLEETNTALSRIADDLALVKAGS
ncbi:MAG: phage tail length tape measure family protein [Burkholderiaceae bacterium]